MKHLCLLSLLFFCGTTFAGKSVILREPVYTLHKAFPIEDVSKSLEYALITKRWKITKHEGNVIHAFLHARTHSAKIRIEYGSDKYQIFYEDSTNLKFRIKENRRYIHHNYMRWIDLIDLETQKYLVEHQ